jgi:hypothetical protein
MKNNKKNVKTNLEKKKKKKMPTKLPRGGKRNRLLNRYIFFVFSFSVIFFVMKNYFGEIDSGVEGCQVERAVDKSLSILVGADCCEVFIGGQFFARYVTDFGDTPIIYPIYADDGKMITRSFPMEGCNVVSQDHLHHRSFWFSHGKVNDVDFWSTDKKQKNLGKIIHKKFLKTEVRDGNRGIIVTKNDWVSHSGEVICDDVRSFEFGVTEFGNRYIDFEIMVVSKVERVVFYDTKEGTFGIRVSDDLSVDVVRAKEKEKKNAKAMAMGKGGDDNVELSRVSYIVNAECELNEEAWGKRSSWVDYVGQLGDGVDNVAGIAILNHPSSFRYPTYWHVRTYGLFAANPFCERGFGIKKRQLENKNAENKDSGGDFVLSKGKSFTLRYRVIIHKKDTKNANITNEFKNYSNKKF